MLSFSLVFIKLREVINNKKKKKPPLKFIPKNKLGFKCHTRIGLGFGFGRVLVGLGRVCGWVGLGLGSGWGRFGLQ